MNDDDARPFAVDLAPITPAGIRQHLATMDRRLNTRLGQVFLADRNKRDRAVEESNVGADDLVLEVGVGLGSLTAGLLATGARVIGVEIDTAFATYTGGFLAQSAEAERLKLLPVDALQGNSLHEQVQTALQTAVTTEPFPRRLALVANLPYSVASPLLIAVLEWRSQPTAEVPTPRGFDRVSVMVQREVGQRIVATPKDGKAYGMLSLICRHHGDFGLGREFPPSVFFPRPKVDSILVQADLSPSDTPMGPAYDRWKRVIAGAFQHRRKRLANALNLAFPSVTTSQCREALLACGMPEDARVEDVSGRQYEALADHLAEQIPAQG